MSTYIYNQQGWPTVTWDSTTVNAVLADTTKEQQKLKQKIEMLPEFLSREVNTYMLTEELIGNFELADLEMKKEEERKNKKDSRWGKNKRNLCWW